MTKPTISDDEAYGLLTDVALRMDELSDETRDIPELRELSEKIGEALDALGVVKPLALPNDALTTGGVMNVGNFNLNGLAYYSGGIATNNTSPVIISSV